MNWRTIIINTRAYGSTSESVIKYTTAYLKGLNESEIIDCIKHFPGDGVDERDQHLLMTVNTLSPEEWDNTFGKVYKHHIDNGIKTIMAGHIALPKYQKLINPDLTDEEIMPATLSPELIIKLLKKRLGFNGFVITDASHMLGLASAMKRQDYVPLTIAAGCDMFLFFNDHEEDFQFMLDGYKNCIITEERLHDALRRILGLKAALILHEKKKNNTLIPAKEGLKVVGCEEHKELARQASDLGITLVKDTKNQLPIKPSTHKSIKLYTLFGELTADKASEKIIIEELERADFEVHLHTDIQRAKGKTLEFAKNYDAAFVFADIHGYAIENNVRIHWGAPSSNQIPWYVYEVPTVFVSLITQHIYLRF